MGKSCLLLRFSDGSFTTSFITTIGYVHFVLCIEIVVFSFLLHLPGVPDFISSVVLEQH